MTTEPAPYLTHLNPVYSFAGDEAELDDIDDDLDEEAPLALLMTFTSPRTPGPGTLRLWAREAYPRTPWRARSLASWRWAWRTREAGTVRSFTVAEVDFFGGSIEVSEAEDP